MEINKTELLKTILHQIKDFGGAEDLDDMQIAAMNYDELIAYFGANVVVRDLEPENPRTHTRELAKSSGHTLEFMSYMAEDGAIDLEDFAKKYDGAFFIAKSTQGEYAGVRFMQDGDAFKMKYSSGLIEDIDTYYVLQNNIEKLNNFQTNMEKAQNEINSTPKPKKPGFFARLFNTSSNQRYNEYNDRMEELAEIVARCEKEIKESSEAIRECETDLYSNKDTDTVFEDEYEKIKQVEADISARNIVKENARMDAHKNVQAKEDRFEDFNDIQAASADEVPEEINFIKKPEMKHVKNAPHLEDIEDDKDVKKHVKNAPHLGGLDDIIDDDMEPGTYMPKPADPIGEDVLANSDAAEKNMKAAEKKIRKSHVEDLLAVKIEIPADEQNNFFEMKPKDFDGPAGPDPNNEVLEAEPNPIVFDSKDQLFAQDKPMYIPIKDIVPWEHSMEKLMEGHKRDIVKQKELHNKAFKARNEIGNEKQYLEDVKNRFTDVTKFHENYLKSETFEGMPKKLMDDVVKSTKVIAEAGMKAAVTFSDNEQIQAKIKPDAKLIHAVGLHMVLKMMADDRVFENPDREISGQDRYIGDIEKTCLEDEKKFRQYMSYIESLDTVHEIADRIANDEQVADKFLTDPELFLGLGDDCVNEMQKNYNREHEIEKGYHSAVLNLSKNPLKNNSKDDIEKPDEKIDNPVMTGSRVSF